MMFTSFLAVVLCVSAVSVNAADRCPGASLADSQEDFKFKYDAAPVVAYGAVTAVRNNVATFQIRCVIKGQLSLPSLDLPQLVEANNKSECHYLTADKSYVVFLQTMKTPAPDSKTMYVLANMEEIEINADTINKFMNEECDDEDDFGIDMTMFYFDNGNTKCGQLTATCNEMNKPSILALTYAPLSKSTTFLGGFKKVLEVPKMSSNDDDMISGKQSGDEKYRGAATMGMAWMPLVMAITGLTMIFNH